MGYVVATPLPGDTLVIVPCGSAKVWDRRPETGPMIACDAYTGYPFRVNRRYAERFGACWRILSAKYGLIAPDFIIPGPYDVSFNRRSSGLITSVELRRQAREQGLDRWPVIVCLGGKHYREAVAAAFTGSRVQIICPFAGLPLGMMIRATKQAIESGQPVPSA